MFHRPLILSLFCALVASVDVRSQTPPVVLAPNGPMAKPIELPNRNSAALLLPAQSAPLAAGAFPKLSPIPNPTTQPYGSVQAPADGRIVDEERRFEGFPTSLLWEPILANRRDPRMGLTFHNTDSFFSRRTADPEVGMTLGMLRWESEVLPMTWQLDIFGKVMTRFSDANYHIAEDYRAGIPITFRMGELTGKFGYEHTSTHIGDDYRELLGRQNITWDKDEVVFALGYLFNNAFRIYGQTGWAFAQRVLGNPSPWRLDWGFDWYERKTTGPLGQPFSAFHCDIAGTNQFVPGYTWQLGWMWKTLDRRLSQLRVYAEFYDGRSQYGQLFRDRERYAGFGVALDY